MLDCLALRACLLRFTAVNMATVGKLIKDARLGLGLTQAEVARALKLSRQAIQNWEMDKNLPKGRRAGAVAKLLKIAPSLVDPLTYSSVNKVDDDLGGHTIPVVHLKDLSDCGEASLEMPLAIFSLSVGHITVHAALKHCYAVEISDDSMAPDYKIGDTCIVDPTIEPLENDDVVAALSDAAAVLRRIRMRGKDSAGRPVYDLLTPNPDHVTVTVNAERPARLLGVVVEHRRKRRVAA